LASGFPEDVLDDLPLAGAKLVDPLALLGAAVSEDCPPDELDGTSERSDSGFLSGDGCVASLLLCEVP